MPKYLLAFLLCFFMFGTIQAQIKAYQFFDQKGKEISLEQVIKKSGLAQVIFFGELHDNSLGHWLQLQVLKKLATLDSDLVLAAEFFERDDQLNINEWFEGKITDKNFEAEAKLWNNYATDYKPLMTFAKEKNLPFIATNIPRKYASLVSRNGLQALDSLDSEAKNYLPKLPIGLDTTLPGYAAMKDMMHGAPGNSDFMIQAQALKDATMAESLFRVISAGKKILHINGSYHSKDGEGILWYLNEKFPDLKVLNIHMVIQDQLDSLNEENKKAGQVILVLPTDSHQSY